MRALDLRGHHGIAPHVLVEKSDCGRAAIGSAIPATERMVGLFEQGQQVGAEEERQIRRQLRGTWTR